MTGYLKPEFKNNSKKYKNEYKTFYCGLCKALKKQYNYVGILSLNYETTAFLILLSGLKKEKSKTFGGSCSISPFVPVKYVDYFQDDFICAAHLSLLIAYYEVKDNLNDIGGLKWNVISKLISKKGSKAIHALSNDSSRIENAIRTYYEAETNESITFEEILKCDGDLIKCIFSVLIKKYDKETTDRLLKISYLFGQWIFLIDACDDWKNDVNNNNFNPLLLVDNLDKIKTTIKSIEKSIEETINELPIKCYKDLIDFVFIETIEKVSKRILSTLNNNYSIRNE